MHRRAVQIHSAHLVRLPIARPDPKLAAHHPALEATTRCRRGVNVPPLLPALLDIAPRQLRDERRLGHPLLRLPRTDLLHHLVDLFQRQPFHLGHQEIRKQHAENTQAAPDEEDLGAEVSGALGVAHHVGRHDGDDAVPEPVAGCRNADTSGADRQRETLADDDPPRRPPGRGEEEDVEADEGNHGAHGGRVVGFDAPRGGADDGDDVLHYHHA